MMTLLELQTERRVGHKLGLICALGVTFSRILSVPSSGTLRNVRNTRLIY